MTTLWRLCKARWAKTAFTGVSAATDPGRWNSVGNKMVYCAESRALASLEILAHVEDRSFLRSASFVAIPVEIPEALIHAPSQFPADWRRIPPGASTRRFGDRFLAAMKFPAMRVPSAVIIGEFNALLNPGHPRFGELVIGKPEPFRFDSRIVGA